MNGKPNDMELLTVISIHYTKDECEQQAEAEAKKLKKKNKKKKTETELVISKEISFIKQNK